MKAFLPAFAFLALFMVAADGVGAASSPLKRDGSAPRLESQVVPPPDRTPRGLAKSDWTSIREAHAAWQHRVSPVEGRNGEWQAHNPGQQWTTRFDGRGFTTSPEGASWQWGLALQSYGFGHSQTAVTGVPEVKTDGGRLTYQWDPQMEEWFINDQRGLEHGFVLRERPAGAGDGLPLEVVLAVRGGLRTALSADRQTLHFRDDAGAPVLNYGGLKVWDADGKILPSHFEAAGENQVRLVVEEAGARYPLTIDPIAQKAYLKADNTGAGDQFGFSIAVDGNTIVVGAPYEDSSTTGVNGPSNEGAVDAGAAFVFTRNGSVWSQQAYLKASQVSGNDRFGWSVAVVGETIVVGALFEDSSITGVNGSSNEGATDAGAAYVFVRGGSNWSQQAYLKPSQVSAGDHFGISVAVSRDTVVIGAPLEDSNTTGINSLPNEGAFSAGAAYVFVRSGSNWTQQAYLKASQVSAEDEFGRSVAVSSDTIVVGALREDSSTTGINSFPNEGAGNAGAAYVFVRSGSNWSQQAYLKAGQVSAEDNFGISVAVSDDSVVVGAPSEDSNTTGINSTPNEGAIVSDFGAAYVFVRSGANWSQQAYLKASQVAAEDNFGWSVAVDGDLVVVGALYEDSRSTGVNSTPVYSFSYQSGAAYVFARHASTWSQLAYLKASHVNASDYFGRSVAVAGDTVVVGAWGEDSNATGVNGNDADNSSSSAGAAYVFSGFGPAILAPMEQWRQLHFGSVANTGDAADSSDFDQDGLVNLLEWAVGTPPKQPNPYQPALVRNGPELEFMYHRSLAAFNAGTFYEVEWTDTLAAASWQTTGVTQIVLSTEGDVQTVRATVPADPERRYLRLRVISP